nr:WD repeat-containing protein 48 [Tanacetum cinerariifolium]
LYLTDLSTRDSVLLCSKEHPIQQLALHDDGIWVATTDSSVHRWPSEGLNPEKVPVYREPTFSIDGIPGIVQHEILNNRRHVLTKDDAGSVKLWEITRGVVLKDYGQVSIPAWFTADTRLGSLSIHLDTPQCFSAEMYSADLNITEKAEDDKINLARETLKGLLTHWLAKKKHKFGSQPSVNGDLSSGRDISSRSITLSRAEVDAYAVNDSVVHPPFAFSAASPPSIITEGSQSGPWRKKITDLEGTEDEKDFPWWVLDCILHNRLPARENTKCSFYLHPCEGSAAQILTQGKLSAPRILRIHKVVNYVVEKMVQSSKSCATFKFFKCWSHVEITGAWCQFIYRSYCIAPMCKFIRNRTRRQFKGLVFLSFDQESCLRRVKPDENNKETFSGTSKKTMPNTCQKAL